MSAILSASIAWTQEVAAITSSGACSTSEGVPMLRRWAACENELKAIRRYRDDWDGMGARSPSPRLVDAAIQILKSFRREGRLSPPSAVSATPLGHVTMEWQMGESYLEAELTNPLCIEWMEEVNRETREWSEAMFESDATSGSESRDTAWQPTDAISVTRVEPAFAT